MSKTYQHSSNPRAHRDVQAQRQFVQHMQRDMHGAQHPQHPQPRSKQAQQALRNSRH